jgi:hypothetical protein
MLEGGYRCSVDMGKIAVPAIKLATLEKANRLSACGEDVDEGGQADVLLPLT